MTSLLSPPARALLALLGAASLAGASPLLAQRLTPRAGVAVDPPPRTPVIPYPGANVTIDPRWHGGPDGHFRRQRVVGGVPSVVYVVPYPVTGDYGSPGVTDSFGQPFSSFYSGGAGVGAGPAVDAAPSYTPDFTGLPYLVVEDGAMLVDLPTGERRSIPPCATRSPTRDPAGRPRTVFYTGETDGVVLRAGQRGRVQGAAPAARERSCYTTDSRGRLALSR